jgi:Phage integrase SAM-like domain/Arm DNA-binding domain
MKSNLTITPVLYPRKDKNGLYPVKIRITKNRKSEFESLGFSVSKSNWLKSTRRISSSHPEHKVLNFEIEKKINELDNMNKKFGKVLFSSKLNVFEDFRKKIESFGGKQYYTKKRYNTTYLHLLGFWGNENLNYFDIDKDFFIDFREYLRTNVVSRDKLSQTPSENTIGNYLKIFKTFLIEKQGEGVFFTDLSFTRKIFPTKTPSQKKTLNEQELWKLDNILPSHPGFRPLLWNSLNTFMFCFWSQGLRIGDCLRLKWGNIEDNLISVNMSKTDRPINIPLNTSNIHRIKWYMKKYYPVWDWKDKKWNTYYQDEPYKIDDFHEFLISNEIDYYEFVNFIENEKDTRYSDIVLNSNYFGERVELDRYGNEYHNKIKSESPSLFTTLDERLVKVNRELMKCINETSLDENQRNQYIFPFLRGYVENPRKLTP